MTIAREKTGQSQRDIEAARATVSRLEAKLTSAREETERAVRGAQETADRLSGEYSRHLTSVGPERDQLSQRVEELETQLQALAEHVWKRWAREYLPSLTRRSKWRQEARNLHVGDLVLMAESNLTRGLWPLARVVRVFPGSDGRARSAELRISGGKVYTRPDAKICFLEEDCT